MLPDYDLASIYPNKKCLSSTQFLKYEKDPEGFYIEYVIGSRNEGSKAMELGRVFSACYADRSLDFKKILSDMGRKHDFIELFGTVLSRFPVLKNGHPELAMVCEYKGWEFRATLDDYVESSLTIIENKTGVVLWDKARAHSSDQITFQNWVHWKKTGKLAKKTILNWWNTAKKTPDIRSYPTSRTLPQLREFEKRVDTVIEHLEAGNFNKPLYC